MFILVVTLPLTCWTSEGETFIPFSRSCLSFPFCKTRILNHGSVGPLLSSGMPFSSYGAKMKTSVNSRIKHGGKNPPSQSLSCGWWGYRCGVIYAAASLRRLASTPWEPGQLSALSLNGLSVPLLIVTLHPQWSAKAFFPHKMKRDGHGTGTALGYRHPSKSLFFEEPNDSFRKCMSAQCRGN